MPRAEKISLSVSPAAVWWWLPTQRREEMLDALQEL
jgi:hypothetical protein